MTVPMWWNNSAWFLLGLFFGAEISDWARRRLKEREERQAKGDEPVCKACGKNMFEHGEFCDE